MTKPKRGRPAKSRLNYDNAKEALLRSGVELLTEKGFNNTGLDEILKRVNVPKGSFTIISKTKKHSVKPLSIIIQTTL